MYIYWQKRINKVTLLLLICCFSFYILTHYYLSPKPSGTAQENIDILSEPIQNEIQSQTIGIYKYKGYTWTLTAIVEYELSGIVRSICNYYFGWQSHFSPLDICISWGDLNNIEVGKYIKYNQSGRWFYFNYKAGCPVSKDYMENHASNNHIIPANKNILRAIKSIKRGNKVKLKGYLVNLYGEKGETKYWLNSSLSRSDRGSGSCEVFYVTEVIYNNKIYD